MTADTAAGAEIVAAALQDWDRATILGTATRGNPAIQTQIHLSDGWILNLTTARWFSPKGRSVKGKGVQPEIVIEDTIMTDPRAARLGLAADPQVKAALTKLQALRKKGSSFK